MAGTPVFVDTSGLVAVTNRTDPWHAQAVELSRKLKADQRVKITTQWVLSEFLANLARPPWRSVAVPIVEQCLTDKFTRVIPASSDKSWSLVDCISILVCQRLGIREVFSGDHHFEQAGLKLVISTSV